MPIKRDITLYQGATYTDIIYLTEGPRSEIKQVTPGSSVEIETKLPHVFQSGDFVVVSGVESNPNLNGAFAVQNVVDSKTFTLSQSVSSIRFSNGTVVKARSLSGTTFKGQIRQERIKSVGNVIGSVEGGSREVFLEGGAGAIDTGEFISFPAAGISSAQVLYKAPSNRKTKILLDTVAGNNASQQPLSSVRKLLASFQFTLLDSQGGKLQVSIPFSYTASIPIRYDQDEYFYDIKFQKTDGTITTLVYGAVDVIPQVTPASLFS